MLGRGLDTYGTTVRRYDGTTVRRYDGTTVRRYDGTTVRRYDGTTVRRYDGTTGVLVSESRQWRQVQKFSNVAITAQWGAFFCFMNS